MIAPRIANAVSLAALPLVLLVGCGKKKGVEAESPEGPDQAATSGAGNANPSEWSVVGGVALRIDKVRLQKPVDLTLRGERESEEPELMIWYTVENRTGSKVVRMSLDGDAEGRDEHGNTYQARPHFRIKGAPELGDVYPGEPAKSGVICLKRPVASATKLVVDFPPFGPDRAAVHRFEIPSDAWTAGARATPFAAPPLKESSATPPAKPEVLEEKWAGFDQWYTVGDVRVCVRAAKVMKVPLKTLTGREYLSGEPQLVLALAVENLSKVKKLDYHRWDEDLLRDGASVTDEHGNAYHLRYRDEFAGATRYKVIQPGDPPHGDTICIEAPVKAATELRVVLSPLRSGEKSKYRFKIPASAWQGKGG